MPDPIGGAIGLWAARWLLKKVLKRFYKKGGRPAAVQAVSDELDKIQDEKEKDDTHGSTSAMCGDVVIIAVVLATMLGCANVRKLLDMWPNVDGGKVFPTTTTTTFPVTTTTTTPPKPETTKVGNYQAWPLSVDGTNLVTVPAFMFEAWATKDQTPPVGAKYPRTAFWELEGAVYGELTITNGEQGGGFFFVRLDARTLRWVELTVSDEKHIYTYEHKAPTQSKYPIQPTVQ